MAETLSASSSSANSAQKERVNSFPFAWKEGTFRSANRRPIDAYLTQIISAFTPEVPGGDSPVVIVQADTGTGKTSRIAPALLQKDPIQQVYITQPHRALVRLNAGYMAYEHQTPLGSTIGYSLYGEDPVKTDETKVTFLVDQSMVNRIIRTGQLPKGILIIDEAHKRSIATDVLLGLVKLYKKNSPDTKVLITSATIDADKFSQFFGDTKVVRIPAPRPYPVRVEVRRLKHKEHHTDAAIDESVEKVKQFLDPKNPLYIPDRYDESKKVIVKDGTMLVFLPGKEEVREGRKTLEAYLRKNHISSEDVEVCDYYANQTREETNRVMAPIKKGTLRVVYTTDALRTGGTLPKLIGIIDSFQVKRPMVVNGIQSLEKIPVSGSEALQALGRGGRTESSFYCAISFDTEFETVTNANNEAFWPKPEITQASVTSVTLQLANMGLSLRTFDLPDKPSEENVSAAIKKLQFLGALDDNENITERGRELLSFGMDPDHAAVLVKAKQKQILPEGIILHGVLATERIVAIPSRNKKDVQLDDTTVELLFAFLSQTNSEYTIQSWQSDLELESLPWLKYEITADGTIKYFLTVDQNSNAPKEFKYGLGEFALYFWRNTLVQPGQEVESDFDLMVHMYRSYIQKRNEVMQLYQNLSPSERYVQQEKTLYIWCKSHFLDYKQLERARDTIATVTSEIGHNPYGQLVSLSEIETPRIFDPKMLTYSVLAGLGDQLILQVYPGTYKRTGSDLDVYIANSSMVYEERPPILLYGSMRKPSTVDSQDEVRTKNFTTAYLASPVPVEWIRELYPKECTKATHFGMTKVTSRGIKIFSQLLFRGTYFSDTDEFLTNEAFAHELPLLLVEHPEVVVPHPAIELNQNLVTYVNDLRIRNGDSPLSKEILLDWYNKQCAPLASGALLSSLDLELRTKDISAFIGEDFALYQEHVLALYPNTVAIGDTTYPLAYTNLLTGKRLTVSIPMSMETLLTFTWDQIPAFPEDVEVAIKPKSLFYTHIVSLTKEHPENLERIKKLYREELERKAYYERISEAHHTRYASQITPKPAKLVSDKLTQRVALFEEISQKVLDRESSAFLEIVEAFEAQRKKVTDIGTQRLQTAALAQTAHGREILLREAFGDLSVISLFTETQSVLAEMQKKVSIVKRSLVAQLRDSISGIRAVLIATAIYKNKQSRNLIAGFGKTTDTQQMIIRRFAERLTTSVQQMREETFEKTIADVTLDQTGMMYQTEIEAAVESLIEENLL